MWASLWDQHVFWLPWVVVIIASLVAAACDVRTRRIPNLLTGLLLLSGLTWAVSVGGADGLLESFLSCIILASPYVLLFLVAGGGAGDAKMMGAVGAWLGLTDGLVALVGVSIAGVVLGVLFLIRRRGVSAAWTALVLGWFSLLGRLFDRGKSNRVEGQSPPAEPLAKMPYGLAIVAGVCLAAAGVFLWRTQA